MGSMQEMSEKSVFSSYLDGFLGIIFLCVLCWVVVVAHVEFHTDIERHT